MSEILLFQAVVFVCGTTAFVASLRFLRRYLELRPRRSTPAVEDSLQARLEAIEQIVEATAIEVERISEANRFMSRLLAERGSGGVADSVRRPEPVITPH